VTARLLTLGAAAGPFYILVGLLQTLIREGFDPRRHPLSVLANGELGWIQVANFLISGALVIAGAVGCRRALALEPGGTWGPILLGLYGIGLVGSGIFVADPAKGFPPGVEPSSQLSRSGVLHFVCGGIAFYSLIAACLVFTRRFVATGERAMAAYSLVTGIGFLVSFAAIVSGGTSASVMLAFYFAIAWAWVWLTVLVVRVRKSTP
jgi:hypothetical protein